MTRRHLQGCALIAILLGACRAQDTGIYRVKLSAPDDTKETPVYLTINDTGLTIRGQSGTAVKMDILYTAIGRIEYSFTDHRRLLEGMLTPYLMLTKGQSHWLVIEPSTGAAQPVLVLRLDKTEFRPIISALNAKSGRRVEVLDPESTIVDPTVGSHDEDQIVPYKIDLVLAALGPAMNSVGCKAGNQKGRRIDCHRSPGLSARDGNGGESVTAVVEARGDETRVRITTARGWGRNWSSPIYREMKKRLGSPTA